MIHHTIYGTSMPYELTLFIGINLFQQHITFICLFVRGLD